MKIIVLPENIGIKRINVFHRTLKKYLKNKENIIIDFSDVARVDLSVIQLITSALKKASGEGTTIKFRSINKNIKKQFHLCGLVTERGYNEIYYGS